MLTMDQREIAGPGAGAHPGDGASAFRRMLVRSLGESYHTAGVAARLLGPGRRCAAPGPRADLRPAAAHIREVLPGDRRRGRGRAEGGTADGLGLRLPAGHHGRGGCPARACRPGDRVAGSRVARRPDHADPPPRPAPTRLLWGSIPTRSCAKRPARCSPPGKPAAIWPATSCQTRLP